MCLTVATVSASNGPPLDPGERAKGASKVILATVTDVEAAFGENTFGDRLILSHVTMQVDETMKGAHESSVVVTIEGGTVGDLTLDVSDMPKMATGERAVLFLSNVAAGGYVLHGRGSSVVKVGADNRATDANLTVDDIRAAVKAAQARGNQ
jgi:hypothetical protein